MLRKKWFNPARSLQKNSENMTFAQRLEGVYRIFAGRLDTIATPKTWNENEEIETYRSSKNHIGVYDIITLGILNAAESFLRGNWLADGSRSRNVFRAVMAPLWLPLNGLRAVVAGIFTLFAIVPAWFYHKRNMQVMENNKLVMQNNKMEVMQNKKLRKRNNKQAEQAKKQAKKQAEQAKKQAEQKIIAESKEKAMVAVTVASSLAKFDASPDVAANLDNAISETYHTLEAASQGLATSAKENSEKAQAAAASSSVIVYEKLNGLSKSNNVVVMTAFKEKQHPVKTAIKKHKEANAEKATFAYKVAKEIEGDKAKKAKAVKKAERKQNGGFFKQAKKEVVSKLSGIVAKI